MKKILLIFTFILSAQVLTGCGSGASSEKEKQTDFSSASEQGIKKKAKEYTEEELQNDEVPLNEYIKLTGKIEKSDGEGETLKKGDRFILSSGSSQYQVFNEQEQSFSIGDTVTVYGEYYGFIKAFLIEKAEE